jgi:DivIVA domain-containing protein
MPLQPQDIVRREFREAFRGYNQADVDLFLDEVVDEFSRVHEENQKMKVRLAAMQQELARLREGRPGVSSPREASRDEPARADVEVRARVRKFLEDLLRQVESSPAPPERAPRESLSFDPGPLPGSPPGAPPKKDAQREPFWAGE